MPRMSSQIFPPLYGVPKFDFEMLLCTVRTHWTLNNEFICLLILWTYWFKSEMLSVFCTDRQKIGHISNNFYKIASPNDIFIYKKCIKNLNWCVWWTYCQKNGLNIKLTKIFLELPPLGWFKINYFMSYLLVN